MGVAMVLAVSFMYGVTNKLADLMNEHGLFWFRGAATALGFVWGGFGVALVTYNPAFAAFYLGLTLSWFLALKLDHTNHAVAGALTVLAAAWFAHHRVVDVVAAAAVAVAFYGTGLAQRAIRGRSGGVDRFLRLRLRLYLIPLVYGLFVDQWLVFVAATVGMLGAELVTNYYRIARGLT